MLNSSWKVFASSDATLASWDAAGSISTYPATTAGRTVPPSEGPMLRYSAVVACCCIGDSRRPAETPGFVGPAVVAAMEVGRFEAKAASRITA